ncbi:MAG: protein kinase domain-containing protein [Capsulimonadaceae bacterium]
MAIAPGSEFGPYRVDAKLGEGGMGKVYKVWNSSLNRHEALKVLPTSALDTDLARRFMVEARTAAGLRHPSIAAIHVVGETDEGVPFFTMELIEGMSLGGLLAARRRLPVSEVVGILAQLASALDYAHKSKIVHRDIKPGNILLETSPGSKPSVKLVDFGIARAMEDADGTRITKTGFIIGTPDYMSPEQASGAEVDHRTDIYSLGVVAYEMLCGKTPFGGDANTAPVSILMRHIKEAPPQPLSIVPDLPPYVNGALLRALNKSPGDRFARCGDFVDALANRRRLPDRQSYVSPPSMPPTAMPRTVAPAHRPESTPRPAGAIGKPPGPRSGPAEVASFLQRLEAGSTAALWVAAGLAVLGCILGGIAIVVRHQQEAMPIASSSSSYASDQLAPAAQPQSTPQSQSTSNASSHVYIITHAPISARAPQQQDSNTYPSNTSYTGNFQIICAENGMALACNNGAQSGASAVFSTSNPPSPNQSWNVSQVATGRYKIVCNGTGLALDNGGRGTNGATVLVWTPKPDDGNQEWSITDIGEGHVRLNCIADAKALDAGWHKNDGDTVVEWDSVNNINQQWTLVPTNG